LVEAAMTALLIVCGFVALVLWADLLVKVLRWTGEE
jgi:hypothetical protein